MIEAIRARPFELGDAYHQLFMGRDTDAAEMAAIHLSSYIEAKLKGG